MSQPLRRVHVLVACADPATRARLVEWLTGDGRDVSAVRDASEALVRCLEEVTSVVFVDLERQEMSGARSVELMRAARPGVPIVVITPGFSGPWMGRVARASPYLVMTKPLDRLEVEDAAASAVRRAVD